MLVVKSLRWVLLAVMLGFSLSVVFLATRGGVALSQDSVSYLAAAQALAAGDGLMDFDGEPLTLFPPGLPLTLGFLGSLGMSIPTMALVLNLVSLVAVITGTYVLGYSVSESWKIGIVSAGFVSLSASFTEVFVWLWTEPVFTALAIALLVMLVRAIRQARLSVWVALTLGLLVSALFGLRYIGLLFLPIVIVGVWSAGRDQSRKKLWINLLITTFAALLAPIVIVSRNLIVGAGPLGERSPGVRGLQDSLVQVFTTLGDFVLPPSSGGVGVIIGVLLAVLVSIAVWQALISRDPATLVLGFFVLLYVAAITLSQSATRLDAPSVRLLAPMLPVVAVLATLGGRRMTIQVAADVRTLLELCRWPFLQSHARSLASGVLVVLASLGSILFVTASMRADQRLIEAGDSGDLGIYAASQSGDVTPLLKQFPAAAGIASNDPWSTYLALNRPPVLPLPPSPLEWPVARVEGDRQALIAAIDSGRVSFAIVLESGMAIEGLDRLTEAGISAVVVDSTSAGSLYRLQRISE